MNQAIKRVKPGERIEYRCEQCGRCCRNIRDQLMLEPRDAYSLGQYLKKGSVLESVDEVYARFTHPVMLDDGFPIFAINTQGEDESCIFLRNGRCSVYEARMRVCRLYPLTVDTGRQGSFQYYQCLDCHRSHFKGGTIAVRDWMHENFSEEDRCYLEHEAQVLPKIGKLLRRMGSGQRMDELFHILFYRYYNYSLNHPFMEQYEHNMAALLTALEDACGRKAV